MIEAFARGATVAEVESVIQAAVPAHLPPEAVLAYYATTDGVEVRAGEPASDYQRAAIDAVRRRWPE